MSRSREWQAAARTRPRRWWGEVLVVALFYVAYSATSAVTGGKRSLAVANALREVHLERQLGIYFERSLQSAVLEAQWLVKACDVFYATIHFLLPIATLLWLYFKVPHRYRVWRNALGWATAIALVVFALFPVAPPRLLPPAYGFVDTMTTVGGAGHLDSTLLKEAGNQYAAMPSLHVVWAAWCAAALAPAVRRRWLAALLWADPFVTAFVVLVTANHFVLDVLAGLAVLAMGALLGRQSRFRAGTGRTRHDAWDALARSR
ncbi:MAG: phosphatase PAP2 family protein [Acidimicrobiales bacterium]